MACYDRLGNLGDGRPAFTGDFDGDGRDELLHFCPRDERWWLGRADSSRGPQLEWRPVSSAQGGERSGRFWTGTFSQLGSDEILFHSFADGQWHLARYREGELAWTRSSADSGNALDFPSAAPTWVGDFNGDRRDELLAYVPGDGTWSIGAWNGEGLTFGSIRSGDESAPERGLGDRAYRAWNATFSSHDRCELLVYRPDEGSWWLGQLDGIRLAWRRKGSLPAQFGQVRDGRPFFAGDFDGDGLSELLFWDCRGGGWWLGSLEGEGFSWTLVGRRMRDTVVYESVGETIVGDPEFGDMLDGRPFWTGDFNGDGRAELLFHWPGDGRDYPSGANGNWWLGCHDGTKLEWRYAGHTRTGLDGPAFGDIWDGRPFWQGSVWRGDRAELVFYCDGSLWLGSCDSEADRPKIRWRHAGGTGRPYTARCTLHLRCLGAGDRPREAIDEMLAAAQQVYWAADMLIEVGSFEVVDVVGAIRPRDSRAATDGMTVYLTRTSTGGLQRCEEDGGPAGTVTVSSERGRWELAHQLGHALGLDHRSDESSVMSPNAGDAEDQPQLFQSDIERVRRSALVQVCSRPGQGSSNLASSSRESGGPLRA